MANSLTPMSPTYWSKRMGYKLFKSNVFRSIANFEEKATLSDGQIVDRPYRSNIRTQNYTKGTALTAQDLTATSDQLTVNTIRALLMYIDNVDKIQNKYSAANLWADEAATRLANDIDAAFLYQAVSETHSLSGSGVGATDSIDDGDIGGTAGNGITLTTSNVLNVFSKINRKLDVNNVPMSERFLVLSPQFRDILWQYIAGKQSLLGDNTGENGNIGTYAGLQLYLSNNLTGSATWLPANNPSNNDTITINGITFTFVTTIGSTAGNVLIKGTTALTLTSLVAFINAGGVTTDAGVSNVSVSAANQDVMKDWVGVDGTTYMEVRAKGASYMTVSGSDATDVWTAAKQIQHCLAGRKKAIDCVIQKEPGVEMASTVSAGKSGMNILPLTLFGVKTFNQGKSEIFDVQVRSDAY
jgi:hypothetical protein